MEFFDSNKLGLQVRRAGCSYVLLVSDDKAVGEFVRVDFVFNTRKSPAVKDPISGPSLSRFTHTIYKRSVKSCRCLWPNQKNRQKRHKHYQLISINIFTLSSQPH